MRTPSFKSWIIYGAVFVAGFATCAAYTIHFLYRIHVFHSSSSAGQSAAHSYLQPPYLFAPQPATFDFVVVGKDAAPLKFEQFRGRVVILNIWATSCGPCLAEMPSLGKLAAHYSTNADVAVICLSDESAGKVFKNSLARDSEAPIYSLDGRPLPSVYQLGAIPVTFVIDTNGVIVVRHVGAADWADQSVVEFIDSLREGPIKPDGPPDTATLTRNVMPVPTNLPQFTMDSEDIAFPAKVATNRFGLVTVDINLSGDKADELRQFTQTHLNQKVQILVGTNVIAEPVIRTAITRGHIQLHFATPAEAQAVVDSLTKT
jgi:thiol-disulfide isomerase/thioredoxin